jgi:hypothetical protein
MKKLGVSFMVFNGEELLIPAIIHLKDNVDFVSVVYQEESNNRKEKKDLQPLLKKLKPLVDVVVKYTPNSNYERWNLSETQKSMTDEIFDHKHNDMSKRQMGLEICRANGCDYFMNMDTDEFYVPEEVERAKETIVAGGYDSSFCKMQTYYKYTNCVIDPPEEYYVPFIYKITPQSKIEVIDNDMFPVIADGQRRIRTKHPLIFKREELEMHHLSYVRKNAKNLLSKISTSMQNILYSKNRKEKIMWDWNNFKVGNEVAWAINQTFKTKEVEPKINITI